MKIKRHFECKTCKRTFTSHEDESECFDCIHRKLQSQNAQFAGQFHVDQPIKPQAETVNHPAHYNAGSIEVIEAIEDWKLGFCDGNVVKYVARFRYKNGIEDLKKARWYLNRLIQKLEAEEANVGVSGEGNRGQHQPVQSSADNNHGNLSPVHSCGNHDASGQGEKCGEQSGDSVAENDGSDQPNPSYSNPFRQRTEGNADGW